MNTEMLTTRIDRDTKVAFTHICEEVGLSPSQAIKLFTIAVISYGGIPFQIKVKQPNETTLAAMLELEQGKGHKAPDINKLFSELTDGKVTNL